MARWRARMPTGLHEVGTKLRVAAASYWTAGAAWAVMTALHLRWLQRSAHAGDVLSAYGAGLVVLGLLVAARPFIRGGLSAAVQAAMPQYQGYVGFPGRQIPTMLEQREIEAQRPAIRREVITERVIAVAVVVVGTLMNGWGTPLARRWGWPV